MLYLLHLTLSLSAGRVGFSHSSRAAVQRSSVSAVATGAALSAAIAAEPATHPAFELINVEMIDEYTIKCATYRHIKSGAELISAQADDDNKVFGIVFRTPVTDSTGVPHILEHSVLCGSDKYTSKEPFAELLKGSLQTFLNAFTYPDRTCYPVASQNTKDFYNLVNVYLDAVLHPRSKKDPMVLEQEGWHYELESPEEPLTFKGVVFNEMKGVYSSPDSLMYRAAQQATFPDNTYAVDSGGDPADIPSLTFEKFNAFHDAYYHPANSRIFFYGDDDLTKRLELLDEYLSDFDAADAEPSASEVKTQPLKTEPWRVVEPYPVAADAEEEPTSMVMLNWLVHEEPLDGEEELALGMLDHLLMGTPTSVLYKALIESGLGTAVVGGGLSDELKQATFSVGLKGVKQADVGAVEALTLSTLAQAAEAGFEADAIEASMNTIEFGMREFNTGGFPKGIAVMLALMPRWLYGNGAPTDALRFEAPLKALKERLASGEKVFENLLKERLVRNGHLATVEMQPDAEMAGRLQKAEEEVLEQAKAKMSDEQVQGVIDATAKLKQAQLAEDTPEQLATIPCVGLADLEREVKVVETATAPLAGGGTLLTHALPTAGVVYADVLLDMTKLPWEELPAMRLLSRMLLDVGTSELDPVALQRRIGARTGGVSAAMLYEQPVAADGAVADPYGISAHLALRGKATAEKAEEMMTLMHAVLSDAKLDSQPKAIEMLKESKTRLEASFISSGNSYASMRLGARRSVYGALGEATQGVTYYEAVKALLEQATSDWPSLLARLEKLRASLLAQDGLIINLTADPAAIESTMPHVEAFVAKLPATSAHPAATPWQEAAALLPDIDEAYAITTQVNYVGAAAQLFSPGEQMDGSLYAVARYLSRGYLWDNVRVVGGAYGGGCSLGLNSGVLSFSSYRDPNLQGTLDIYAETAKVLDEVELSDEALEQAIVGAVGDLDSPMTSQQKGFRGLTHHLTGVTTETRQRFRDEVIATDRASFKALAERLRGKPLKVAVFGSQEALDKANAARGADEQIAVTKL